jgi:DNA-binding winged helix-turn-helix (wHTH) protein
MTNKSTKTHTHGVCLDRRTGSVYVDGKLIEGDLSELEYRALTCLAERIGQIVSKDDLARGIYRQEYYVGADQPIYSIVYRIRTALGDTSRPHRYLETVPRRGYRLKNAELIS